MNWMIVAAGIASATVLGAHAAQPGQQDTQRPQQAQPGRTAPGQVLRPAQQPLERSPEWSEADVNRPGPHHELLNPVIGEWTALITVYRDGQEHRSRGVMQSQWVLQNRFIRGVFTGEEDDGDRNQGISFIGYNNAADHYEATWLDTNSTQIMHATGHLEPSTRVLTLHGSYNCTRTGSDIPIRIVARMDTDERIVWEMFENPIEQREHKTLEIVYTRRAPAASPEDNTGDRLRDQFPNRLPGRPQSPNR
jgi:hypothetical protein